MDHSLERAPDDDVIFAPDDDKSLREGAPLFLCLTTCASRRQNITIELVKIYYIVYSRGADEIHFATIEVNYSFGEKLLKY